MCSVWMLTSVPSFKNWGWILWENATVTLKTKNSCVKETHWTLHQDPQIKCIWYRTIIFFYIELLLFDLLDSIFNGPGNAFGETPTKDRQCFCFVFSCAKELRRGFFDSLSAPMGCCSVWKQAEVGYLLTSSATLTVASFLHISPAPPVKIL